MEVDDCSSGGRLREWMGDEEKLPNSHIWLNLRSFFIATDPQLANAMGKKIQKTSVSDSADRISAGAKVN